jgi:hypothetical protein
MIYRGRYLLRRAWVYFNVDWQREMLHDELDSPFRDLFICCHNNRSTTMAYLHNSIWLDIQLSHLSGEQARGHCMDCPVDWLVDTRAVTPPEGLDVGDEVLPSWRNMAAIQAWYDLGTEGPAADGIDTRFTRLLSDDEQFRFLTRGETTLLPQRIQHEPQSVRLLFRRAEEERRELSRF